MVDTMVRRCVVVSFLIVTSFAVNAAEPDGDGFVPLFNGKDLSGWAPVNVAPNTFTVKDGLIACTGVPTGVMRTDKMYQNFIVECEWRHLRPGGNSGFFVWSDAITSKGQPFTRAIEVQVLDGPGDPQGRYTTHGDVFAIHGAVLTPLEAHKGAFKMRAYPIEKRSKPSPQWNHYRIECVDGSIKLAVNGKVVTEGKDASPRKGYICLESEGGQVEWRNLRIKELPASGKLEEKQVAQADEGFKSAYDGLDLGGWIVPEKAAAIWKASDWTLKFTPSGAEDAAGSGIQTDWNLSRAELLVDIRSAMPVLLEVHGREIRVDPVEAGKAVWRRAKITALRSEFTATVDDKEVAIREIGLIQVPIGDSRLEIRPTGPAEIANVYVKPLR
jgi:Domain of Unknown Function (DUF1080)